jgi:hypothetical protein
MPVASMSDTDLLQPDDATTTMQAKAGSIRDARGRTVPQLDPVAM